MGSLACATPPLPLPLTPTAVAGQTHLTREYVRERFRHRLWLPDLRPKSASCLRHAPTPLSLWGAQGSGICATYWHSAPASAAPCPRPCTHTCHAGQSSAGNCLKSFTLHQFALLLPLLPTLNCKCVCVSVGERGGGVAVRTRRNNNAATAKNEMLQRSARFLLRVLKRIAYLCV